MIGIGGATRAPHCRNKTLNRRSNRPSKKQTDAIDGSGCRGCITQTGQKGGGERRPFVPVGQLLSMVSLAFEEQSRDTGQHGGQGADQPRDPPRCGQSRLRFGCPWPVDFQGQGQQDDADRKVNEQRMQTADGFQDHGLRIRRGPR